ncbi:uncharacterized protein B0I36DRAFT_41453 [Microdochium trichocladiopsis]|uniref:NADH:flavin oxidoreductase/NADH oxidase N-terminal domain-containing protein n=1 Tax=Microdochium trichocladiopsis TaxID=1682393 RepID=A0A9P8XU98_9PEZI|nr:uncharacterized protein B0I36DRAFT_41453 [Microdochium trichocladiopsis]KAH7016019.1 hypothetical protein B0I36DRAFT_41453 [Microdochium trichocladiopsis]
MSPSRFEKEDFDPTPLGEPLHFEFSGQTAKNRFLKAAMTERLSTWHPTELEKRGIATPELINVYKRWGEGGFGMVLSGNTMIEYDHLESAGNLIIPRDAPFSGERFETFKALAEAAKKHGSLAVVQLSHPGRQVTEDIQKHPISASDVQLEMNFGGKRFAKPRAMEKEDIERVIKGFVRASEYASKAGWDGVQLHGAHGYLLAQFLSPLTNKRIDEYGGSLANRSRLILEIADAVRVRVPKDFIVGIKINSIEFEEGGFPSGDCVTLCSELEKHGIDFVELSGGTYQELAFGHRRESTRRREAFFLEFADKITPELHKTKAYVTGGLRTGQAMVNALKTVHGVGLARPATHEFDLPQKILDGRAQSAISLLLSDDDFGMTNMAAGMQMRLVGRDKEPADLSREDHKHAFEDSFGKWWQSMSDNRDNSKFGGVDLLGVEFQPYGTPYA